MDTKYVVCSWLFSTKNIILRVQQIMLNPIQGNGFGKKNPGLDTI